MGVQTLLQLFRDSVRRFSANVLVWEKRAGRYRGITYREMGERVDRFRAGLLALGFGRGERAALIAEGRADWIVSELGILGCGAVNVPISVKLEEAGDLKFRLVHAGCRLAVVSGGQLGKLRAVKPDLPELQWTVVLDPIAEYQDGEVGIEEVLRRGDAFLASRRQEAEAVWDGVGADDPATICYTSGTTADPKGIVLTHRNYTANVEQSRALIDCPEYYICLLILPWDHAFAHTCGIYTVMWSGAALAAVETGATALETVKNIPRNIREIRPHILLSVPALARSFRHNIERGVRARGPRLEALFQRALRLAYAYNGEGWNRGCGRRRLLKPMLMFYDRLLFRPIRAQFGGRLRHFVGGGALLDIELQRFFYALGMPMLQGYGLTEAAPVISANSLAHHKLGSSGRIPPGLNVRICDGQGREAPTGESGEIVVRGENVMAGYWRNEKATAEALRGGWLYTGDIGRLDRDGFLYVLGRQKSLLIANDGEKYSPEGIEEAIVEGSPYIAQLMLYNDQSPYTVALLVPDKEAVLRWLREHGLSCRTREGQEAVLRLLGAEIDRFRPGGNAGGQFPGRWLPAAVAVLGEGFSEQNRMLNSTMKMVRGRIVETHRTRLDSLFTTVAKDICNPRNMTIIETLGSDLNIQQ